MKINESLTLSSQSEEPQKSSIELRREAYFAGKRAESKKKRRKTSAKKSAKAVTQSRLPVGRNSLIKQSLKTLNQVLLLPNVAFEDKGSLPSEKGLYFVVSKNNLVYLGMTATGLSLRWSDHHRSKQIRQLNKPRIHYKVLRDCSEEDLLDIESYLIDELEPLLNQTPVPEPSRKESQADYKSDETSNQKILNGMLRNYAAAFGMSTEAAAERIVETFLLSEDCKRQLELARKYR